MLVAANLAFSEQFSSQELHHRNKFLHQRAEAAAQTHSVPKAVQGII
jgi:hypothetical protein